MSIIVRGWFVRGERAGRHELPAPVELQTRARRAAAPPDAEALVVDLAAAPCSLGVVATIRGRDGDTTVWVADDIEPWATGAGFVFGSVGMVPISALREEKHRRHREAAGHGTSSQE
jgi:hypothetical protein